jgi:cyclase
MRLKPILITLALLLFTAVVAIVTIDRARAGSRRDAATRLNPNAHFAMEKIADGIYVAVRSEPPGLLLNANSVFIVGDRDVLVVDTNVTPSSARESIAALGELTPKPVTTVVNTHWHDDHILGNQVYRDEFPGVEFIGHATTLDDLPKTGGANRQQLLDRMPLMIQQLQASIEQQKSLAGGPLTEEERVSYLADLEKAQQFTTDAPSFQIVLPTRTVQEKLTLTRGTRTVEIIHLGRGHTPADLVVYLPVERIVIAGDLVVAPVPLVGSASHPAEFAGTLTKLLELKPAVIVPGHGPVMRDDRYARLEQQLLSTLSGQVAAAVSRGDTLEQARKAVQLGDLKREFVHDSPLLGFIFDNYVSSAGVAAAYRDAMAARGRN